MEVPVPVDPEDIHEDTNVIVLCYNGGEDFDRQVVGYPFVLLFH